MQNNTPAAPVVSVLMLAYNQQDTIDEAIRSVVLQHTGFPFELVVADDASTDGTPDCVRRWAERYPHIVRLLRRESNLGLQRNFIDAYSQLRGRYMAICEGDDWWCSRHKLSRQVAEMEAHPECTVCFHRVFNYYADTRSLSLSGGAPSVFGIRELSCSNPITNVSVMYRRLPAAELPTWLEKTPLVDYAMHMLHAAHGTVRMLPRPMAVYRQYARGLWSGSRMRSLELGLQVRQLLRSHFADSPLAASVLPGLDSTINAHIRAIEQEQGRADGIRQAIHLPAVKRIRNFITRLLPLPRICDKGMSHHNNPHNHG